MAAVPFRKLCWAVDMALDHLNDSDAFGHNIHMEELEWGWLMAQEYLEVPRWIGWAQRCPGLQRIARSCLRAEKRQHFEMVCSVIRCVAPAFRCPCGCPCALKC